MILVTVLSSYTKKSIYKSVIFFRINLNKTTKMSHSTIKTTKIQKNYKNKNKKKSLKEFKNSINHKKSKKQRKLRKKQKKDKKPKKITFKLTTPVKKRKTTKKIKKIKPNKRVYKQIKLRKNIKNTKKIKNTKYKNKKLDYWFVSLCILGLLGGFRIPAGWIVRGHFDFTSTESWSRPIDTIQHSTVFRDLFHQDGFSEIEVNQKILSNLKRRHWKETGYLPTSKLLNKQQHSKNGNRTENYKIGHWNAGSRLWGNKLLDLQLLLEERRPDACYISEANLWENTPLHERNMDGYRLILPKTMMTMKHSRLALLVREDLDFEVTENYMDGETPTIWGRIGRNKKNSILLGGIYREHRQLGITSPDATRMELQLQQEFRWQKIVENWSRAGSNSKCIVIGDINLDFLRWANPEEHKKKNGRVDTKQN